MRETRRFVYGKNFSYFVCDVHGWDFGEDDDNDVCPKCQSETLTRDKIMSILEEFTDPSGVIDVQLSELKEIIRERLSQ